MSAQKRLFSTNDTSENFSELEHFIHNYDRGGQKNGKASFTINEAADQLTRGGQHWENDAHKTLEISYSFLKEADSNYRSSRVQGFQEFNEHQKSEARLSFQSWSDVANIHFTEDTEGGDGHINLGYYTSDPLYGGRAAFGYYPNNITGSSDALFLLSNSYDINGNPQNGNYGRQTFTHEIGHTLGLQHPGDYDATNGEPSYNRDATYAEDTRGYSVMSYWSESNSQQNFSADGNTTYSSAPLIDDIAAIQKLYGANYTTRAEDTTYGFNSNTGRDFYTANDTSSKLVFSVWDGGGNDTLDFSGYDQDQKINLNSGSFSDVGGLIGNISITQNTNIENAIGGGGNDIVVGNTSDNWLKGGLGNDIIYGGGGADKLWGGAGNDFFVYDSIDNSSSGTPDKIFDFTTGIDKIDFSAISKGAPLTFVNSLTGHANEVFLDYKADTNLTDVSVDFTGHGLAELVITTVGLAHQTDFVS